MFGLQCRTPRLSRVTAGQPLVCHSPSYGRRKKEKKNKVLDREPKGGTTGTPLRRDPRGGLQVRQRMKLHSTDSLPGRVRPEAYTLTDRGDHERDRVPLKKHQVIHKVKFLDATSRGTVPSSLPPKSWPAYYRPHYSVRAAPRSRPSRPFSRTVTNHGYRHRIIPLHLEPLIGRKEPSPTESSFRAFRPY